MFTGKVQGVLSDLGPDLPQNDLSQPVTTNVQDKTSKLPRYSAFLGSILFTVERIVESSGDATYKIFKNGSLVFTIDKAEKAELTDDTPILPTTKLKEILQEKFSEEETQHLTTIIKIQQRAVINKGIQQVFGIMETDAGYVLRKVSPGIEKEPNAYIWLNLADLQKAIASNEFDREVARKHYEKTRQTLVDLIGLKPSIDNIRTKDADRIKEPNTLERAFYLAKVSLAETYLALSQPEEAFRILPEINQQFINHISQDLISDKYNFQFHKAAGLIARAYLAEGAALKEINLKPGKINDLKKQYPHDYPEKIPEATAVLGEAIKVIEKFYKEVTSDFEKKKKALEGETNPENRKSLEIIVNDLSTAKDKLFTQLIAAKVSLAEALVQKSTKEKRARDDAANIVGRLTGDTATSITDPKFFERILATLASVSSRRERGSLLQRTAMVVADILKSQPQFEKAEKDLNDFFNRAGQLLAGASPENKKNLEMARQIIQLSIVETYLGALEEEGTVQGRTDYLKKSKQVILELIGVDKIEDVALDKLQTKLLKFINDPEARDDLVKRTAFATVDILKGIALDSKDKELFSRAADLLLAVKNQVVPSSEDFYRLQVSLAEAYLGAESYQQAIEAIMALRLKPKQNISSPFPMYIPFGEDHAGPDIPTAPDSSGFISLEEFKGKVKAKDEKDYFFRANTGLADALRGRAQKKGSTPEQAGREFGQIISDYNSAVDIYQQLREELGKTDQNDWRYISTQISLAEANLGRGCFALDYAPAVAEKVTPTAKLTDFVKKDRKFQYSGGTLIVKEKMTLSEKMELEKYVPRDKKSIQRLFERSQILDVSPAVPQADYQVACDLITGNYDAIKNRVGGAAKIKARVKDDLIRRAVFVRSDALKYFGKEKKETRGYEEAARLLGGLMGDLKTTGGAAHKEEDRSDYFRAAAGLAECYLALEKYDQLNREVFTKENLDLAEEFFTREKISQKDVELMSRFYLAEAAGLKGQALGKEENKAGAGQADNLQAYRILCDLNRKIIRSGVEPFDKTKFSISVNQAEALQAAGQPNLALYILWRPDKSSGKVAQNLIKKLENFSLTAGVYQREEFLDLYLRAQLCQVYSLMNGGTVNLSKEEKSDRQKATAASYGKAEKALKDSLARMNSQPEIVFKTKRKFYEALGDINVMTQDWHEAIKAFDETARLMAAEEKPTLQKPLNMARLEILLRKARAYSEVNRGSKSLEVYDDITREILKRQKVLAEGNGKETEEYQQISTFCKLVGLERMARKHLHSGEYKQATRTFEELASLLDEKTISASAKLKQPFLYQVHYDLTNCYGRIKGQDSQRAKHLELAQQYNEQSAWPSRELAQLRHSRYGASFENLDGNRTKYFYDYSYDLTTYGGRIEVDYDGDSVIDMYVDLDVNTNCITKKVWVDEVTNEIFNYRDRLEVSDCLSFEVQETKTETDRFSSLPEFLSSVQIDHRDFVEYPGQPPEYPVPPAEMEKREKLELKQVVGSGQFENKDGRLRVDVFFNKKGECQGWAFPGGRIAGAKKFERADAEAQVLYDKISKVVEAKFGGTFRLSKDRPVSAGALFRDDENGQHFGAYGDVSYSFGKIKGWEMTPYAGAGYYFDPGSGYLYAGVDFNKNQTDINLGINKGLLNGELGANATVKYQIDRNNSLVAGVGFNQNSNPSGFIGWTHEHGRLNLADALDLTIGAQFSAEAIEPAARLNLTKALKDRGPFDRTTFLANLAIKPVSGFDGRLGIEKEKPDSVFNIGLDSGSGLDLFYSFRPRAERGFFYGFGTQDMLGYYQFSPDRLIERTCSVGPLKWLRVVESPLVYDQNYKRSEFFIGPGLLFGFIPSPIGFRKNPNPGQGFWCSDDSHFGFRNHAAGQPVDVCQAVVRTFDQKEKTIFDNLETQLKKLKSRGIQFVLEKKVKIENENRVKGLNLFLEKILGHQFKGNQGSFKSVRISRSSGVHFDTDRAEISISGALLKVLGLGDPKKVAQIEEALNKEFGKLLAVAKTSKAVGSGLEENVKNYFQKFFSRGGMVELKEGVEVDDQFKTGLKVFGLMLERSQYSLEGLHKVEIVADQSNAARVSTRGGVLIIRRSVITSLSATQEEPKSRQAVLKNSFDLAVREIEAVFENFDLRDGYVEQMHFKEPFGARVATNIYRESRRADQYRIVSADLNHRKEIRRYQDNLNLNLSWEKTEQNPDTDIFNVVCRLAEQPPVRFEVKIPKISPSLLAGAVFGGIKAENTDFVPSLREALIAAKYLSEDGYTREEFSRLRDVDSFKLKVGGVNLPFAQKEAIFMALKEADGVYFDGEELKSKLQELGASLNRVSQSLDSASRDTSRAELIALEGIINQFIVEKRREITAGKNWTPTN